MWELPGPQRNSSLRPGVLRFGMHRTELWRSHHTQTLFALTEHLIRTTVTVCCTTPLVSIVALITDLVVTARSFVSEQCHSTDTRSRHRETQGRFADTLARKCSTRRPHPRREITWEPGVYSSNKATPAARDTQFDPAVRYAHFPVNHAGRDTPTPESQSYNNIDKACLRGFTAPRTQAVHPQHTADLIVYIGHRMTFAGVFT